MIIFITGNSRSGTTMMSRILGNLEQVFAFQELHFFDEQMPGENAGVLLDDQEALKLYARLCSVQRNGYFGDHNVVPFLREATESLDTSQHQSAISVYLKFLFDETKRNRKSIPCKQTPQNIFVLDQLLHLIPECRIIVMVRDPREVLLSQKNKWKRRKLSGGKIPWSEAVRSRINYHPVTISKIWKAAVAEGLEFQSDPRVIQVSYENLIKDPELVIKKVCDHTGLSYSPQLLDIPVVGSSNKSDSTEQRGVDNSKAGQWSKGGLNPTEIAICEKINGSLMHRLGYQVSGLKANPLCLTWYYFSMPARLGLSLLFNLKRLKNPGKLIKRFAGG